MAVHIVNWRVKLTSRRREKGVPRGMFKKNIFFRDTDVFKHF